MHSDNKNQELVDDQIQLIPLITLSGALLGKLTADNIESPITDLSEIPVHLPPTIKELSNVKNWTAYSSSDKLQTLPEYHSVESQYLCHINNRVTPLSLLQIHIPSNLPEHLQYLDCQIDKELPSLPDEP